MVKCIKVWKRKRNNMVKLLQHPSRQLSQIRSGILRGDIGGRNMESHPTALCEAGEGNLLWYNDREALQMKLERCIVPPASALSQRSDNVFACARR